MLFVPHLVQLYNCSAGQSDCSQCRAVPQQYECVWCSGSPASSCVYRQSCSGVPAETCPSPRITQVSPLKDPPAGLVCYKKPETCLSAGTACFWASRGRSSGDDLRVKPGHQVPGCGGRSNGGRCSLYSSAWRISNLHEVNLFIWTSC